MPIVQSTHLLGLALFLGASSLLNLSLLGVVFPGASSQKLFMELRIPIWAGLAVMVVSGALIFLTAPSHYFSNTIFRYKMLLFAVAAALELFVTARARKGEPTRGTRIAGGLSLAMWISVGLLGRAIGFY